MDKFSHALQFTLSWEGGYVNDPLDLGGATNMGITQRVYDGYLRAKRQTPHDVRSITTLEVREIYWVLYWNKAGCENMMEPTSTVAFDIAVNMGVGRIGQFLADVRLHMDGNPTNDAQEVAWRLLELRTVFYYNIVKRRPNQSKFLKGWLNRTRALREYCRFNT
jgi:lysozyme family protein